MDGSGNPFGGDDHAARPEGDDDVAPGPIDADPASDPGELRRLRELLVGADHEALRAFAGALSAPERYRAHLAQALTEAIEHRDAADGSITRLFVPIVERSLTESVRTNPEPLADALFPIMGPAIRKSISDTMNQALEGFNRALEESFSARALKWRFDALRSGRSYAEIALLHTLDYRVEQLFLIHRDTSVLLQHLVADDAEARDADMVSGMLGAIQDFVSDSFAVGGSDVLDTLRLGELTVCVEAGPRAILAAVVQGGVPEQLRTLMRESVEAVHQGHRALLADFDGDAAPFDASRPTLERCMLAQRKAAHEAPAGAGRPWKPIAAGLVAATLVGVWQWDAWRAAGYRDALVDAVRAEPGYVLLEAADTDDGYLVRALVDPLARPLADIVDPVALAALEPRLALVPHASLDESFVAARVASSIGLPSTVDARVRGDTLAFAGTAPREWLERATLEAVAVPGVSTVDLSGFTVEAPPPIAAALPPPPSSHERLVKRLVNRQAALEREVLTFASGATRPDAASEERLDEIARELRSLVMEAGAAGATIALHVEGYSDTTGAASTNLAISRRRAVSVVDALEERRVTRIDMRPVGKGSVARDDGSNERRARLVVDVIW